MYDPHCINFRSSIGRLHLTGPIVLSFSFSLSSRVFFFVLFWTLCILQPADLLIGPDILSAIYTESTIRMSIKLECEPVLKGVGGLEVAHSFTR